MLHFVFDLWLQDFLGNVQARLTGICCLTSAARSLARTPCCVAVGPVIVTIILIFIVLADLVVCVCVCVWHKTNICLLAPPAALCLC